MERTTMTHAICRSLAPNGFGSFVFNESYASGGWHWLCQWQSGLLWGPFRVTNETSAYTGRASATHNIPK